MSILINTKINKKLYTNNAVTDYYPSNYNPLLKTMFIVGAIYCAFNVLSQRDADGQIPNYFKMKTMGLL